MWIIAKYTLIIKYTSISRPAGLQYFYLKWDVSSVGHERAFHVNYKHWSCISKPNAVSATLPQWRITAWCHPPHFSAQCDLYDASHNVKLSPYAHRKICTVTKIWLLYITILMSIFYIGLKLEAISVFNKVDKKLKWLSRHGNHWRKWKTRAA